MNIKEVKVKTPQGIKTHGFIQDKVFLRTVRDKDRMIIFDAWSIHPDALREIEMAGVNHLEYVHGIKTYRISLDKAKEVGFEKVFSGGRTVYLPIKHWEII